MAAPNLKEIEWAISELENEESSEKRYTLLASLYTCRNEMMGLNVPQPQPSQVSAYSNAAEPVKERLGKYGDSEFLQAVEGLDPMEAWKIIDGHMKSIRIVNPRAYDSVMTKLRGV